MKRKAILLNAINGNKSESKIDKIKNSYIENQHREPKANNKANNGNIIIAIGGTSRGVGCTHTAISIAHFLSNYCDRVALVEKNKNNHFKYIYEEDLEAGILDNSFRIDKVDYYSNNYDFIKLLNEGYGYIVLDLSTLKEIKESKVVENESFNEFIRASQKILVTGIKEWQIKDLEISLDSGVSSDWNIYVTNADTHMIDEIRKEYENDYIYEAPYCPNPFLSYKDQDKVFEQMLENVLGIKKKKFF